MTRSALGLLTSMLLASGPCLMAQFKKGVLDEGYLPSLMKRYQNGDKKAADELGYFYESPIYKQFDYPQAANWYRIAYNAGFRPAGLAIARLITTYKVT